MHFYHWEEFRAFVDKLCQGHCEVCALHGAAVAGEQQPRSEEEEKESPGHESIHIVETYRFPHPAVALLLPDRKTGKLSSEQKQIADIQLKSRFVACRSADVADSVHLDVKTSIFLQRYATLHSKAREVQRVEEKFTIDNHPAQYPSWDLWQVHAEIKELSERATGDEVINDCDGLFTLMDADY
jgi:hypothetical protein